MARRLIDANELEHHMFERFLTLVAENGPYDHYTCGYQDAIDDVEDAPTIDAVEVVRCRECKHWGYGIPGDGEEVRVCVENAEIEMPCDGFCHKGERREPDENNLHD